MRATAVILLILTALGCGVSEKDNLPDKTPAMSEESFPQPASDGTYIDTKNGFRIQFPKGWRTENRSSETLVAAISPLENSKDNLTENISIFVERHSAAKSTEDLAKAIVIELIQSGQIVEPSESGTIPTRAGLASYVVGIRIGSAGRVKVLIAMLKDGDDAWRFICNAEESEYKKYEKQFIDSIKTFRNRP